MGTRIGWRRGFLLLGVWLCGCLSAQERPPEPVVAPPPDPPPPELTARLVINELVSQNDGVAVDELGETDDYVELLNVGDRAIDLGELSLVDGLAQVRLPARLLQPGERLLLWTDDDPEQGDNHLALKLSSQGEPLSIVDGEGQVLDQAELPSLGVNETFARHPDGTGPLARCRYASPGRDNGRACEPPAPEGLPVEEVFASYALPDPFPPAAADLGLTELALRPARFIEITNQASVVRDLSDYQLWLAPHAPGLLWPVMGEGTRIPLPAARLMPGERRIVEVTEADVAGVAQDPAFEGVLTLFASADAGVVERVDFMHWPEQAALERPADRQHHRFCVAPTPDTPDGCQPLRSRAIGDRVRHLRTENDISALSTGNTALGVRSAKMVLDLQSGGVVHFLRASDWPLHYTFVREAIEGLPHLDRCDPVQDQEFVAGWVAFSQTEYFETEGRRFLLTTLNEYPQVGLSTVEFATGDSILPEDMRRVFFAAASHALTPEAYSLRPQSDSQATRMHTIEGTLPIVAREAPFANVQFQPLTAGVAYGVLTFVSAAELGTAALGPRTIVVTDDVPNDIPFVGGLITEAFQTPLAHVNVLSQSRGTPNMALRDARTDPRLADHFDQLVRLEVVAGDFSIAPADPAEADAFFEAREQAGSPLVPRIDTAMRGLQPLSGHTLESLPAVGAKAAQLAELLQLHRQSGTSLFSVPEAPAAIPVVHSLEHFEASGGAEVLASLQADAAFRADPAVREAGLAEVRAAVLAHPVDAALLAEVEGYVEAHFGGRRVRFRSSSNTEDLPGFTGAGLYTSLSGELDDPDRTIDDAIRTVWASLWNTRAYDERAFANIEQQSVAMGVLIHPAFLSEKANGVAVSRNVQDPIDGRVYYLNVQIGEATVTNPAPGITTDQVLYELGGYAPGPSYQSRSNLAGQPVLSDGELGGVVASLQRVHDHFAARLPSAQADRWFAMEIEWKLIGEARQLMIKQARPHNFGSAERPSDCREF